MCTEVEDAMNSGGVKNLGMKVVPPNERTLIDLKKIVLDLNCYGN